MWGDLLQICLLQVEKFAQNCLWAFTKKEASLGLRSAPAAVECKAGVTTGLVPNKQREQGSVCLSHSDLCPSAFYSQSPERTDIQVAQPEQQQVTKALVLGTVTVNP